MIDVEGAPCDFDPFGKTRLWWMRFDLLNNRGARFIDTPNILRHMTEEDVRRKFDESRRGR